MGATSLSQHEAQRLAALYSLHILDTPSEERFDRITRIVAEHFAVPIVELNFIDADRQWTKSHVGRSTLETERAITFCTHTILENRTLCVSDACADPQFADNPLVVGAPHIRFYAGVPVHNVQGYAVGSLCIIDTHPRTFTPTEQARLHDFAVWAEQEVTSTRLSTAVLQIQAAEDALQISEARYRTMLASLHEGVIVQGTDGRVQTWNEQALQLLGITADMLCGHIEMDQRWYIIDEAGRRLPWTKHPGANVLQTGKPQHNVVLGVHTPDDSFRWMMINAQPLRHVDGHIIDGAVSSFFDITHLKQVEHQLQAYQAQLEEANGHLTTLATTDDLTGVLNRRALMEQLARLTAQATRTGTPLALALLDVDYFKCFNDQFGHLAGDEVLRTVARVLRDHSRVGDVIARYGGEEFVVVLPQTDPTNALAVAERLRAAIETVAWEQRPITVSVGVAWVTPTTDMEERLLQAADEALYRAKALGRNCVFPIKEIALNMISDAHELANKTVANA